MYIINARRQKKIWEKIGDKKSKDVYTKNAEREVTKSDGYKLDGL